jgi:hypothetical protein
MSLEHLATVRVWGCGAAMRGGDCYSKLLPDTATARYASRCASRRLRIKLRVVRGVTVGDIGLVLHPPVGFVGSSVVGRCQSNSMPAPASLMQRGRGIRVGLRLEPAGDVGVAAPALHAWLDLPQAGAIGSRRGRERRRCLEDSHALRHGVARRRWVPAALVVGQLPASVIAFRVLCGRPRLSESLTACGRSGKHAHARARAHDSGQMQGRQGAGQGERPRGAGRSAAVARRGAARSEVLDLDEAGLSDGHR